MYKIENEIFIIKPTDKYKQLIFHNSCKVIITSGWCKPLHITVSDSLVFISKNCRRITIRAFRCKIINYSDYCDINGLTDSIIFSRGNSTIYVGKGCTGFIMGSSTVITQSDLFTSVYDKCNVFVYEYSTVVLNDECTVTGCRDPYKIVDLRKREIKRELLKLNKQRLKKQLMFILRTYKYFHPEKAKFQSYIVRENNKLICDLIFNSGIPRPQHHYFCIVFNNKTIAKQAFKMIRSEWHYVGECHINTLSRTYDLRKI